MSNLSMRELPEVYAVCRLDADAAIPDWADGRGFVSVSRTADELSIICPSFRVPAGVVCNQPWTCFQLLGPFDLSLTGIAVRLIQPISDATIGFLFVTTYDTDYLLVPQARRDEAVLALTEAGVSVGTVGLR